MSLVDDAIRAYEEDIKEFEKLQTNRFANLLYHTLGTHRQTALDAIAEGTSYSVIINGIRLTYGTGKLEGKLLAGDGHVVESLEEIGRLIKFKLVSTIEKWAQ